LQFFQTNTDPPLPPKRRRVLHRPTRENPSLLSQDSTHHLFSRNDERSYSERSSSSHSHTSQSLIIAQRGNTNDNDYLAGLRRTQNQRVRNQDNRGTLPPPEE